MKKGLKKLIGASIIILGLLLITLLGVGYITGISICYAASLIEAARDGDTKTVVELLDNSADVNEANTSGNTALIAAATNGRVEIARFLLDRGAQVDKQNNDGQTPLMSAAAFPQYANHVETAELLLDRGAQVNKQDKYGDTALINAVRDTGFSANKKKMIELLLKRGADKYVNEALATAAFECAGGEGLETVKFLIDKGADINAAIAILEQWETPAEDSFTSFGAAEGIRVLNEIKSAE